MNQSALVYIFGAASVAAVGLVFLYKWWIEERRRYDLDWAIAHLALALAVSMAFVLETTNSTVASAVGSLFFWLFASYLVTANLSFIGRTCPRLAAPAVAIFLSIATIAAGLDNIRG